MLLDEVKPYLPEVIAWRRDIHQHPELGFQEYRTSKLVADKLTSFGLEVKTGFADTAVLGILDTGRPGKVIALRADMDALPLQELNDVPYRSENDGICHACGHDAHTANLLGVAKYISEHKDEFCGVVKFLFQPAEEGPWPGGAKKVVDSGVLADADCIIGMHNIMEEETGKLIVRYGPGNASGDEFTIKVIGVGCHGARPHTGRDPIIVASQIVTAFQNIISRELNPLKSAVISFGSIHGGAENGTNIIPQEVVMKGTVRALEPEVREMVLARMKEVVEGICTLNHATYTFDTIFNVPCLTSEIGLVSQIEEACIDVVGKENVLHRAEPVMGFEDFAYYTQNYHAAFFYFGGKNEKKGLIHNGHSPHYNLDEDALQYSMAAFISAVKKLMVP